MKWRPSFQPTDLTDISDAVKASQTLLDSCHPLTRRKHKHPGAETQRRQNAARNPWNPASNPAWLSEQFYKDHVQATLRRIQVPIIQKALSVSEPYALRIRGGRCVPHPRHWQILARLVGLPQQVRKQSVLIKEWDELV